MGVDSQHYRRVTGLYASRVSSSRWSPSSSWRGRRGIVRREEGRADIHELWWREEVARQRREILRNSFRLGGFGALWVLLLCHLSVIFPTIWQMCNHRECLGITTSPLASRVQDGLPLGFQMVAPSDPGFPDVIVSLALIIIR